MKENYIRFALLGLLILFLAILFTLRKMIAYPFCRLETYTGKVNKGKSSYFLLIHLILSLGMTMVSYVFLDAVNTLSPLFEDPTIRLSVMLLLWLFWIAGLGWAIEQYLQATDKEYRDWKKGYFGK